MPLSSNQKRVIICWFTIFCHNRSEEIQEDDISSFSVEIFNVFWNAFNFIPEFETSHKQTVKLIFWQPCGWFSWYIYCTVMYSKLPFFFHLFLPPQPAQGQQFRCHCHHQRAPSSLRQSDRQMDKRMQHHYDKATQTYWRPPSHAVSPHIHSAHNRTPDEWSLSTYSMCCKTGCLKSETGEA